MIILYVSNQSRQIKDHKKLLQLVSKVKGQMFVVGSRESLEKDSYLSKMLNFIEEKDSIFKVVKVEDKDLVLKHIAKNV